MKQFPSLYLAQSWVRKFHPTYIILMRDSFSYAAGPADAVGLYLRAGWVQI